MMHRVVTAALMAGSLYTIGAGSAAAQIRGSEHAVVAQTIDGTTVTIEYSRPVARGRTLFGDLVPYDVVWTPGANWATTLDVDKDIRLNGTDVPAGKYSMWMVPRQGGQWRLSLDPNPEIFHFQKPDSSAEQIHIAAAPQDGPHAETLTWSFPAVTGDAAKLQFQWGEVAVPVDVVVQPTKPVMLAADERAIYVGTYDMQMLEGIGWPTTGQLEIFEEGEMLRGKLPFPIHPGDELVFDLVPAGRHRFSPALYRGGKLFNIEQGGTFEFDVSGERATAIRFRGIEGTVFGQGQP
ncbi:MAG: DUF2911 domain-containing protein [Longimicrobiales bacterium]